MAEFHHRHRVTYSDCTVGNHIYYARYLDLLEHARGEFFRHVGVTLLDLQARDFIFPVIECRLRYKAPARYDDLLEIALWLTAAERVRLNISYRIVNQSNTIILLGETAHVCTGLNDKLKRLPEALVTALHPYCRSDAAAD
jgi:acyl-CoA thioester hydrolase